MRSSLFLRLDERPSASDRDLLHLAGEAVDHPSGRLYESEGDPEWMIPELRRRLMAGETLTAVLIPEFAIGYLRELTLPRGCLVVHEELMRGMPLREGWRLNEVNPRPFLVLRPIREGMSVTVTEDLESFQESLHSSTPTVIRAQRDEVLESPYRWYGKLADPSVGGAVTLITLSAWHASRDRGEIWLRNPAALGLSFSEDEELLPSLVRNGDLKIHGVSAYRGRDHDRLLAMWMKEGDHEISRETFLRELNQLDEFSHSVSYAALLTLRAPDEDPQVRVTSGLVVEQVRPFVAQNLVIATERSVIVKPGDIVPIALPAWCMNQDLPSPGGQEIRQTPFVLDLAGVSTQAGVWSLLQERVIASQP